MQHYVSVVVRTQNRKKASDDEKLRYKFWPSNSGYFMDKFFVDIDIVYLVYQVKKLEIIADYCWWYVKFGRTVEDGFCE